MDDCLFQLSNNMERKNNLRTWCSVACDSPTVEQNCKYHNGEQ